MSGALPTRLPYALLSCTGTLLVTFKVSTVNDTIQNYKTLKKFLKTMSRCFRLAEGTNGLEDDEADVERLSG
jgi:hypothetical protein